MNALKDTSHIEHVRDMAVFLLLILYSISKRLRIALMVRSKTVIPRAPHMKPANPNSFSGTTYELSITSNFVSTWWIALAISSEP